MSDDPIKSEGEEPLRGGLDLDAWEPQLPPSDFAERVLAKVREEKGGAALTRQPARSRARAWGLAGGAAAVLALAAAFALKIGSEAPAHGEAIAKDRTEVSIGSRARAVLEPGAHVSWNGDDVVQATGDVFYRVEPGARFKVHTSAGDVEVKGTCFTVKVRGDETQKDDSVMQKRDVKSGSVGAALTALAFVAVYEGRVAVSHAGEHVDLAAGESAQVGKDGVTRSGDLAAGQKTFDAKLAQAAEGDPLAAANQNLVGQVDEYRKRLELILEQKSEMEKKLQATEAKLASSKGDGGSTRNRSEWDLDSEDWADLAKKGSVKYRLPCARQDGWTFDAERMQKIGLPPTDAPAIKDAYAASYKRVWAEIKPLCQAAIGTTNEIVEKIGLGSCPHLIYDVALATDKEGATEAHTQAAEIRAGLRAEPGPNEKIHPVLKMFLVLTNANKNFEGDLAKAFGPEEAHRLAFSDDMCTGTSQWGGGKKRGGDDKK